MRYFSIITPMYNREKFIARAINSCLDQDFDDFEIIVVDDGSTDNSVREVEDFTDPRITMIRHDVNQGVSVARNTGIDAANGKWVICLDSDDELMQGGLSTVYKRTLEVGSDIAQLRFMCQLDTGEISPEPPLIDEVWDYKKYMKTIERNLLGGKQETLCCRRRETFQVIRFPEGRALEAIYHLDFAKQYLTRTCPDVVRLYHQDAENQIIRTNAKNELLSAPDQAKSLEAVIRQHGDAMAKWAPSAFRQYISGLATLHFLSGSRCKGIMYAIRSIKLKNMSIQTLAIILFGLLGPEPLAWLKAKRSRYLMAK